MKSSQCQNKHYSNLKISKFSKRQQIISHSNAINYFSAFVFFNLNEIIIFKHISNTYSYLNCLKNNKTIETRD